MSNSVDGSRSAAEQRAHESRRLDRTLWSERASEQNAERSIRIDLACCRHGVPPSKERKGTPVPIAGELRFPAWDSFAPDGAKGSVIARVAAHEKKKALGPCELRALLRDAPSSPCTRHGRGHITGHRRILRSNSTRYCSGARPSLQPTSLARQDRNRFRSLQGRVTSATPVPGNWTSCMAG